MAGAQGFEPGLSVLETDVLAVDTMPLQPARNLRPIPAITSPLCDGYAFDKNGNIF